MEDLIKYFNDEETSKSICDLRTSYKNHLIAFAAEKARKEGAIIDFEQYESNI